MPRTKSAPADSAIKKPRPEKKTVVRTIHPRKRTKSVLVDVIEDEPLAEAGWPEYRPAKTGETEKKSGRVKSGSELNGEIDNQKKYFSDLARSFKDAAGSGAASRKDKSGAGGTVKPRSVGLYRRLVIKFIILVGLLALAVFYFSFSKLTVLLSLKGESISDTLLLKITDANLTKATTSSALVLLNDPREEISGVIKEINAAVTKTYPASGETYLGEDIVGRVRLINNSPKSQTLVATTRLLSPDNKLFRIKNAVNIPAGGEVAADIYADKPAVEMAIKPTTFTIPGLWLGLQDKIYAQSDVAFVFSKQVRKYVTSGDLEAASKDINAALTEAAKKQAVATGTDDWLYLVSELATVTINAKAGDKKEEFTASAGNKIIAVSFSKATAAKLAAAKFNLIIPDNKELSEFKPENIVYSFDNYDSASGSATVKAAFNGTMILKSDSDVINPEQLVNLSAEQIGTYLKNQNEIKDYELKFSPAFIKKAPSLVDRIKIEVKTE
ncbi:MAG: hypothetical protein Q8N57_02535 [bacterium]|nr:hypothetical protein [bacterium]